MLAATAPLQLQLLEVPKGAQKHGVAFSIKQISISYLVIWRRACCMKIKPLKLKRNNNQLMCLSRFTDYYPLKIS